MPPVFYRLAYFYSCRKGRQPQLTNTRDIEASMIIGDVLHAAGYSFAGSLYQYPASLDADGLVNVPKQEPLSLGSRDILSCITRPPKDDNVVGNRFIIPRSFTWEEQRLMDRRGPFCHWFERCSRSEVILTSEAARLSPEIRKRQCMMFRQHGSASYSSYGPAGGEWTDLHKSDARTAAFLVFADAWPGGPRLFAAFGMSGNATLWWARLLSRRFRHLMFTTEFVMAEIHGRLPHRPRTLDFVDELDVEILGTAPLARVSDGKGLSTDSSGEPQPRSGRTVAGRGREQSVKPKPATRQRIGGAA